jgi:hypothetical protein
MSGIKGLIKEQLNKLLLERTVSPTLRSLLDNAERVLGKSHKQDRSVKIHTITPMVGVKTLRIGADVMGTSQYKTSIIFYDVDYSKEETENNTVPVDIDGIGTMYYKKPNINDSQVRVDCSCKWFQYACEWYLKPENGLAPSRKPRPYTKVQGSNRPSPNPDGLPCVCKHVYQVALEVQSRGLISNS